MKRVHLDTSAYSALLRGHPGVAQTLRRPETILVCPIVLGELRAGFRIGTQAARNEELLQSFLATPRVRTVPIDDETADRYAVIQPALRRAGTPIPTNDIWIAASAMQHGSGVVTTDPHFEHVQQIITLFHDAAG